MMKHSSKPENLKHFESWEKQCLKKFRTPLGIVYVVVEWNQHYGDLITAFQIGDQRGDTGVENRYTGDPVKFMMNEGRLGVRSFEKNSLGYEFLLKPLGLELPDNGLISPSLLSEKFEEID